MNYKEWRLISYRLSLQSRMELITQIRNIMILETAKKKGEENFVASRESI
jgi:hypothetical protein